MATELGPEEVAQRLKEGSTVPLLLDVRETWEREISCIEPSVHIPMNSVPERLHELPRDRTVIVYCHHGSRSAMVAAYLETEGFSRVVNLRGGIDAWSACVDPRVVRYG
ncbi:MAG: sulfurtransferase [Euryarchaeota archaeon]|nr:sulfurtransferase [Euryarchaeota archaeon]MDE1836395.1 sulfurtransferase [Euryarchaeota archaeon]MDE1881674.1 sulfurtransferase [Euryarchaeota archaeon]MDE2044143.1 sulfurtransferase [Thermoplasmata archaeon]